jgi:hypothetical protein
MDTLEISLLEDGTYEITEYNDERLFLIGQILLNDTLRSGVSHALEYATEFGMDQKKEVETKEILVRISPTSETTIELKFIPKSNPENALETDMNIDDLIDLIDDYEDAVDEQAHAILISREQDTFTLYTTD